MKNWCLSKLQNMEFRLTGGETSKHLPSPSSVAEALNEAERAGGAEPSELPVRDEFSQSPELHQSPGHLDTERVDASVAEGCSATHYFDVHVESSPGTASNNHYVLMYVNDDINAKIE